MKKIDAHAHIFERIASFGKCGELRPIGNGVCRWANGDEMAIIPKGYGDKEFMAETLLKIMDEEDVEKAILLQLARIAKAYPAIPSIVPDGIYGPKTKAAVEKFQAVFGLPVSGVVDYNTWYEISNIYVAVTRIAELA